jgi:hypothetical protein
LNLSLSATSNFFRPLPFCYFPFFVLFEAFALPPLDPAAGFAAAFLAPPELALPAAFPLPPALLAVLLLLPAPLVPPDFAPADFALLLFAALDAPDFEAADFPPLAEPDEPEDLALPPDLALDFAAVDFEPEDEDLPLPTPLPPPFAEGAEAPDFPLDEDFFPPVAVLTAAPAAPTTAPDAAPARISPATSFALSIMVSSTPLPLDAFLDLPPVDFDFDDPFVVVAMSSLLKLISKLLRDGGSKLCANISHRVIST